jgi:hypothetical protein
VDETRVPEGADEGVPDDTLEQVNARLATIPETDCRMEDILMEW